MAELTNYDCFSIPGVFPLKGSVVKAKCHYYADRDYFVFPPSGHMFEVAYFGNKIEELSIGRMERENGDILLMAWFMRLAEIKDDPDRLTKFRECANNVAMRLHPRANASEKIGHAYQGKENEEKSAELMGHSLLCRARELVAIQDQPATSQLVYCCSCIYFLESRRLVRNVFVHVARHVSVR